MKHDSMESEAYAKHRREMLVKREAKFRRDEAAKAKKQEGKK